MKNSITFTLFLFVSLCYGQDLPKFSLTNGVKDAVINVGEKSAREIYEKSVDWLNSKYKNPSEVVDERIKNKMIKISGFQSNFSFYNSREGNKVSYALDYSIQFKFKDGKYKIEFSPKQVRANGETFPFVAYSNNLDEDDIYEASYMEAREYFERSINNLSLSLYNYITNSDDDDNW